MGFPGGTFIKNLPANAGATNSIPGEVPGIGKGNPQQYSCLANPMDRGASKATVHRVAESDTTEATEHVLCSLPVHLLQPLTAIDLFIVSVVL